MCRQPDLLCESSSAVSGKYISKKYIASLHRITRNHDKCVAVITAKGLKRIILLNLLISDRCKYAKKKFEERNLMLVNRISIIPQI